MTKSIRIENADISDHKVIVQVWQVGTGGEPDSLVNEHRLDYPTAMASDYVHTGQYLVVKEE